MMVDLTVGDRADTVVLVDPESFRVLRVSSN